MGALTHEWGEIMAYYVYYLKLDSGIHIGEEQAGLSGTGIHMRSDSFFSALYAEYMRIFGGQDFLQFLQDDAFLLSDLLPYKKDLLYFPKPYISIERSKNTEKRTTDRKVVKALHYIPIHKLKEYFSFLREGSFFPEIDNSFGEKQLLTKNAVSLKGEDTLLYSIESFHFYKEAGLYFILQCPEEFIPTIDTVLDSLGRGGIGGKRNVGYGRFRVEKSVRLGETNGTLSEQALYKGLRAEGKRYLLLSSYVPQEWELQGLMEEEAAYKLLRCGGFVTNSSYADTARKHKQCYVLAAGSTLGFAPQGRMLDLNFHGAHPIYRLGKALYYTLGEELFV